MKQGILQQTASFIGHKNIVINNDTIAKCNKAIENLIVNENIKTFLFGSKSEFDSLCLNIVGELKLKYKFIERIYVRAEYENISLEYKKYLLQFYDDTIYSTGVVATGKQRIQKNKFML